MSRRMPLVLLAFGLSAAACTPASADEAARPTDRPAVRVYTNDDLERVHPFAGQTGGASMPAFSSEDDSGRPSEPTPRGRGEEYWRAQAKAVSERVRVLEERAAGLRERIAERERAPEPETVFGGRRRSSSRAAPSGSGSIQSLKASLAALERRIQLAQDDLADRARRAGALPGWLR